MKKHTIIVLLLILFLAIVLYFIFYNNTNTLSASNQSNISENSSLPNHDLVNGEEPLERFPGSIMLEYHKQTQNMDISLPEETLQIPKRNIIIIDYGTTNDTQTILRFYQGLLSKWNILNSDDLGSSIIIDARKDCDYISVQIFKSNPPTTNYSRIHLEYINNVLPSQDLESGNEIIQRYPGSIIVKAQRDPDTGKDIIYYMACDEEDKVFNWYVRILQDSGWSIISMDSGEYMIDEARKDNQIISIDIERTAKDLPLQIYVYPMS